MPPQLNLIGKRFGKNLVIAKSLKMDKISWWIVQCDCGNIKRIRGISLNIGDSQSCGICTRGKKTTEIGESAKWALFTSYVIGAKRRGFIFTLSLEEFLRLTGSPCHYCGMRFSSEYPKRKHLNGSYKHNGIDRVDSRIGYVSDNCAPCCKICNYAKRELSSQEFKEYIKRAYNHLFNNQQLMESVNA